MAFSARRPLVKAWQALHAAWLVVGVTLLMLLVVEVGFRIHDAYVERDLMARRTRFVQGDPRRLPYWQAMSDEFDETRPLYWKPWVYFARNYAYHGKYINLDTSGRRIVPQGTPTGPAALKVFTFGGSTMWGVAQRDEHTIPAEIARRLQTVPGLAGRVQVTNYAENGYVSTQGLLALITALRAGERPDVVVFYDGINDTFSTVQFGAAGTAQNEYKRQFEFQLGRQLDRTGWAHGPAKDLHTLGLLAGQALQTLSLADWVKSKVQRPQTKFISADSGARQTVSVYVDNVRTIEALGQAYGFTPFFVWQPNLHATEKKPTEYEARLLRAIDRDPLQHRLQDVHRVLPPMLDSAMASVAVGRFVDDASMFRGDTALVYTDVIGHTVESSVPRIVDTFWPQLERVTRDVLAHPRPRPGAAPTLAVQAPQR